MASLRGVNLTDPSRRDNGDGLTRRRMSRSSNSAIITAKMRTFLVRR